MFTIHLTFEGVAFDPYIELLFTLNFIIIAMSCINYFKTAAIFPLKALTQDDRVLFLALNMNKNNLEKWARSLKGLAP